MIPAIPLVLAAALAAAKPKACSEIRSDFADLDRNAGIILFDGHVQAHDDKSNLCADQVWISLEGTNQVRRLIAEGHVVMTNGSHSAACARAIYRRSKRRVEMYGDGKETAHLQENGPRRSSVDGDEIIFYLGSEQVEVRNSEIRTQAIDSQKHLINR